MPGGMRSMHAIRDHPHTSQKTPGITALFEGSDVHCLPPQELFAVEATPQLLDCGQRMRRASVGDIRAARRAGSHVATVAVRTRSRLTAAKLVRSVGDTP